MYKITIIKLEDRTTTKRGEWTVVNKRPWKKDEVLKENDQFFFGSQGDSLDKWLSENPVKPVMGYTPDVETVERMESKIFEQSVDDLDLPEVIKAINNL